MGLDVNFETAFKKVYQAKFKAHDSDVQYNISLCVKRDRKQGFVRVEIDTGDIN